MNEQINIRLDVLHRQVIASVIRLPLRLGTEVVRYTMVRFREQGWDGKPWQRRKPGSKNNVGRALLVKSGRLRRSIRITKVTADSVTIGSDVPYARIHNEGFYGQETVKAHERGIKFKAGYTDLTAPLKNGKFKARTAKGVYQTKVKSFVRRMRMPRRQFLGDSPYLRRNLERIITAELNTGIKSLFKH